MSRDSDNPCEDVADRVALGEPLGDLAGHAASCGECRSLAAVVDKLSSTHREVDPGLGFSARMTVGAQQRLAVRRRRRVAGGLAAVTAAGVLGVFVMTRAPKQPLDGTGSLATGVQQQDPRLEPAPLADEDLRFLVEVAATQHTRRASAPWGRIEKPLHPYMKLVRHLPEAVPAPASTDPSEDMP
ncbi:MAG: hypothetical protein KF773_07525 [Deltaproteobacteria bacterium]|nr:hypothetical protein [Deltaproteobacteria bacterium]MCW5805481.1 hypothetical protein [Deltaproteobacteria bacterium]